MAIFSFFKTQRPKQFNFKPRYYDERKEKIDEIIARNMENATSDPEAMKSRIKYGLKRRGAVDRNYESNIRKRSNRTLLLTMIVLFLLAYLLLSNYLPDLIAIIK